MARRTAMRKKSSQQNSTVAALLDVCHRLAARGFVAAMDGNVSARLSGGNILITRSGVNKGLVTRSDFVEMTPEGTSIGDVRAMSSEVGMHLFIYHERPDIHAIVHAHPVCATGFATARQALDGCLFPEVIAGLGVIPLAEYATPSTEEVARSIAPLVRRAEAILLANHGVVTYGRDPHEAYFRMEKVEHTACTTLVARILGGGVSLTPDEVDKLRSAINSLSGTWAADRLPFRRETKNH